MTRPNVLVLASDALFPHFFSAESQRQLDEVTSWTRSAIREDSPSLREQIANADVLMTTWHSPFLTAEMLGSEPAREVNCALRWRSEGSRRRRDL